MSNTYRSCLLFVDLMKSMNVQMMQKSRKLNNTYIKTPFKCDTV